jgi:hypothetical protein
VALNALGVDEAVELTRTGDIWLFRGRTLADRAIRAATNAPVNHVGMAVVLEDMPPLMWHAELGQSLPDVWTGKHRRGAQLHVLADAVRTWQDKYGQDGFLRQLGGRVTPQMEDAVLRQIALFSGTPFPSTVSLGRRWLSGRARRQASLETVYCAELVASAYEAMGLLPPNRPVNWFDPGRFWSGDRLELVGDFALGPELTVLPD